MFAVTSLVALAVPVLGYVGVQAIANSEAGKDAQADNLPIQSFPYTPSTLLLTTDGNGNLASATVMVLAPTGSGGSIVPVPLNADLGFADDARQSLAQAYASGGVEAAVSAIESLVLVPVNFVIALDPTQLAGFLQQFEPLDVTLQAPVEVFGADGRPTTIAAGSVVLDAANAASVLSAGAGTVEETVRYVNAEAVWTAVSTAIGPGRPGATPIDGPPADGGALTTRLAAGPVGTRGLVTIPLTDEQNPNGFDVVQLDRSDAVLVFGSIAPGSMSAPSLGPVFRIEAAPGYDAAVKRTIAALLFLGGNVVSVDQTIAPRPDTVFRVPDDIDRVGAEAASGIFGTIAYEDPVVRIEGVDVTIVLGTEYLSRTLAEIEAGAPVPTPAPVPESTDETGATA
jgi:hypothetical protein